MEQKMESEKPLEKPENINPEITRNFVDFIKEKSEAGPYRVEVKVGDKVIPIDVFPTVFPPRSDYSVSSKSVFETFGNLQGLEVADIGSGSGIESIVAAMAGANHVDAADINQQAVDCSKHNVEMNGLQNTIEVFYSDLFQNFPEKKYDLIIANLPIVNFDAGDSPINQALYDKGFEIHKRLFRDAKKNLIENGIIIFTHANLQSAKTASPDYDFIILEKLIDDYGYKITEKAERKDLGYKWINYKIALKR
ncbi:methyltransferase [Patescibacteria group bacterium]|nr:methyltransferase [Patescibacteria group bacterium]MBU1706047.1 methyltransferase [Patescibacteria group bacterium]MBU1870916.1 methyltransferase [Patescibacteria group bacterium]